MMKRKSFIFCKTNDYIVFKTIEKHKKIRYILFNRGGGMFENSAI